MTDEQMAAFLGFAADDSGLKCVRSLPPAQRALFERMGTLEHEVNLWTEGLGPKPSGVLIDLAKGSRRSQPIPGGGEK